MKKFILVALIVVGIAVVVESQVGRQAGQGASAGEQVRAAGRNQARISAKQQRQDARRARIQAKKGTFRVINYHKTLIIFYMTV